MEGELKQLGDNYSKIHLEISNLQPPQNRLRVYLTSLKLLLQDKKMSNSKFETFLALSATHSSFIVDFVQKKKMEEQGCSKIDWSVFPSFMKPECPSSYLKKVYEMVDDPNTDCIICWSATGTSFYVFNESKLEVLLQHCLDNDSFAKFCRTLHAYGFNIIPGYQSFPTEFSHDKFERGKKGKIEGIISVTMQQITTVKDLLQDMEEELQKMRKDKIDLTINLPKLKKQEEETSTWLCAIKESFRQANTKLVQLGGTPQPNTRYYMGKQDRRPWMNESTFIINKMMIDMKKLEKHLNDLELNQSFIVLELACLTGLLRNMEQSEQDMSNKMTATYRNVDLEREVFNVPLVDTVDKNLDDALGTSNLNGACEDLNMAARVLEEKWNIQSVDGEQTRIPDNDMGSLEWATELFEEDSSGQAQETKDTLEGNVGGEDDSWLNSFLIDNLGEGDYSFPSDNVGDQD